MKLRRFIYWGAAVVVGLLVACYAILSSMQFDDLTAVMQEKVKEATGRELVISGPVDLQVSFTPSIDLQDVQFANAPWGSRREMVSVRRLAVEVDLLPLLFGDIVVSRLVLDQPDILLETNAEGVGNWEFEPAASEASAPASEGQMGEPSPGEDGIILPDVQAFAVRNGRLTIRDHNYDELLRLELTRASGLVPEGEGSRSLTLEGRYNDSPFRVDGSFGNLRDILSGEVSPLDLTLSAGGAQGSLKGTAGDLVGVAVARLSVTAEGEDLSGLSPFLGARLPRLGPYKVVGDVVIDAGIVELTGLAMQVADSDLAGTGTLDLNPEPAVLSADLVSKSLRLSDFADADARASSSDTPVKTDDQVAGGSTARGSNGRLFPEDPLPLDQLSDLDARLAISAGELWLTERLTLQELKLAALLGNSALTVEPITGQLAGGSLAGRAKVEAAGTVSSMEFDLQGEGMDFGALLRDAEVSDDVRGELDLDIALSGQGESLRDWASGLNGYVQAVSLDGTIDNKLLGVLSAGFSDITGPLFGSADTANVNCIIGRFDIAGGQAKSRALVLDTGTFAVTGRGAVDLSAEQVNLAFDTETSEPSLASLAVPFLVVGPMESPAIVPDPIGAAGNVAGTVGTVAEAGGNLAAKMVNTLSGLVGSGPLVSQIGSDQTLCDAALAALGEDQVVEPAGAEATAGSGQKSTTKELVDDVEDATKDVGRSIKQGVKSLFGN